MSETYQTLIVKFVLLGKRLYALSQFLLVPCQRENVDKVEEHFGNLSVSKEYHTFKSYFHIALLLLDCPLRCLHPLTDKVDVAVYKIDDAVVILGVGIAHASALNHLEGLQRHLYRLDALAVNGG